MIYNYIKVLRKTDLLLKDEQFCFMESVDSISIFTINCYSNLCLLNNTQHVFADGKFLYAPKHFLQLSTVRRYMFTLKDFIYQL